MVQLACVDVPALPLQLLLQRQPAWAAGPAAVVADDRPQAAVLHVNAPARAAGVLPGSRYAPALALAPGLHAGTVSPKAIARGVADLLERLEHFSPGVEASRREPGVFWLDAGGLEGLFESPLAWAALLRDDLAAVGYQASVAVGFGRFGTYAAARALAAGDPCAFASPEAEARATHGVPLNVLALPQKTQSALAQLGIRTVGAFLALGPAGLERRFGPEAAALYRFASGGWELPLAPSAREPAFELALALEYGEGNAERLLFVLKPLVDRLLGALGLAGRALVELQLRLTLDGASERLERIRTAEPTLRSRVVMELVGLRLGAAPLSSPVVAVALAAASERATSAQLALFEAAPRRDAVAAARAFARLRAAFGHDDIVAKAVLRDRHSPEGSFVWEPLWELAPARPRPDAPAVIVRRFWERPEPLRGQGPDAWTLDGRAVGPVAHWQGPYRIAGGWWRHGIARDYYFVETGRGELLWVFFDGERQAWFLHGEIG